MQVTYLGLEGKYFLLLSEAGSQSFMWFIYTPIYPISKGISPRLPFNCSLAEQTAAASQKQAAEQK